MAGGGAGVKAWGRPLLSRRNKAPKNYLDFTLYTCYTLYMKSTLSPMRQLNIRISQANLAVLQLVQEYINERAELDNGYAWNATQADAICQALHHYAHHLSTDIAAKKPGGAGV